MGFDLNQVVVFYVTVPAILKLPMTGFEPRISGVGNDYFGKCAITTYFFIKMGNPRPLFRFFGLVQTNNTIFATNKCENVMSVQYSAPGFEPTTSQTYFVLTSTKQRVLRHDS